ncbi:filamentous hemagglutinin N-terminal domain-containing protein [Nostoc sp. FACHB-152]|uniref:two-partner secretion domain-containing protein n=1 Tax=unclassified Nostoc TaxID=2593658 RepID=UPI00168960FD|nr:MULTISPECIES: filamentous hemagglutinin N-terminal domain-containing protein [unclassified Nostoc]MBD2448598.1 filamentous hemagglutinin N-terminal domain-containing protein [Nostoc sp. FACHB-152]MBD2469934.1 filamentous hemagglutinin N-terminal domain-containing protein [Nostoc sp. FACHB-145]
MNNRRNFAYGKLGLFLAKGTILQIAVVSILTSNPCLAQIIPDTTLGNESSHLINGTSNGTDLIEGGARRGSNLYHSFAEFNVNNGQRVYFANPTGVANILSRVTGNNPSNILGTLGVNGAANLFLLNPKGIIFGPNAQLDIQGSFLATTANSFKFLDGSQFSATDTQAPSLLTMSVPVGVQFGSQPTASITNQGNLVAGKDLTLNAGNLDLEGTLQAGGDLTLQAQNDLKVRDSESNPFIAAAGGNMLAQGNQKVDIYALNHPDSGFYSGGNMVLQSENTIGGDAHFWAGGSFRIEKLNGDLGNLFSPDDPVIRATGDVSFSSYTGASLHILAGGSVNIASDVTINNVDSTGNSLQETVTLSDGTTLEIDGSKTPTLDIRAGVDSNYIGTPNFTPNLPIAFLQNPTTINPPTNANINIYGNIKNEGGLIFLTNQYQPNSQLPGNITTNQIYSGRSQSSATQNGGNIVIQSKGHITTDQISSGIDNNYDDTGNAGNIIIQSSGNITIGSENLNNKANAGAINASVITRNSEYYGEEYNSGNSGKIQITSSNGDITVEGGIFTNSTASGAKSHAGDTGDITLQALQGTVTVTANQAGAIVTRTKNDTNPPSGSTGKAGNITIDARTITINGREKNKDDLDVTSESAITGNSGNITFTSQKPLELDKVTIGTDARNGNGGDIEINAPSLTLTNSQITTTTKKNGTGNAGNIKIITQGSVLLKQSEINTNNEGSGYAGNITINASDEVSVLNGSKISSQGNLGNIDITTGSLSLNQKSGINTNNTNNSGYAGNININARDEVSLLDGSKIFSQGNLGYVDITTGSLSLNQTSEINTDSNGSEYAGYIKINASDEVSVLNGSKISSQGNNGYIDIFTRSLSLTNGAQINSSLTGVGDKVGYISIQAKDIVLLQGNSTLEDTDPNQTGIFTQIRQQGKLLSSDGKGNITLNTDQLIIKDGARLSADTDGKGKGNAGDIKVNAQQIDLKNQGRIISVVRENAEGNSGSIELKSRTLSITDDARISVSNLGTGNAGNVIINATNSVLLARKGRISSSVRNTATGKGGNINIDTNFLAADGGKIEAQNQGQGDGGKIAIKTQNLLLRRQSKITATAGSTTKPGNGGSITIDAKDGFVVAVPSEDSDIIANAFGGKGGSIKITANRILGFQNQGKLSSEQLSNLDKNGISDISASSDVGEDGEVSLNTLSIDPTQGLVALPTNLVDTSRLIAQGCGSNSNVAKGKSEFVITGRGGLPPSPDDTLKPGASLPEWVVNNTANNSNNSENMTETNLKQSSSNTADTLVEAVGMVRSANGDIVLTAQPTTATGLQSGLSSQVCGVVPGNVK